MPREPIAVKAKLAATRLAVKRNKITPDEAIDRLESLRFQWRGDDVEAATLKTLGQLYAKLGDYRHALTTMKIAVQAISRARRQSARSPTKCTRCSRIYIWAAKPIGCRRFRRSHSITTSSS